MAKLTQETIKLLDRLFNLKGENNVIIEELAKKIADTENLISKEDQKQRENEIEKTNLSGSLQEFENQVETFKTAFTGLDDETFKALRAIGVNIQIGTMLETIAENEEKFCVDLEEKIKEKETAITENEETRASLTEMLEGYMDSKQQAEEDREKLISLLEQSLSTDDLERESLTTSYVKKILSLFDQFSKDEVNEITKLIIFPDEGLYEYAESYEDRLSKGLIKLDDEEENELGITEEVIEEKKDITTEEMAEEEKKLVEESFAETEEIDKEDKKKDVKTVEPTQSIYEDVEPQEIVPIIQPDLSSMNATAGEEQTELNISQEGEVKTSQISDFSKEETNVKETIEAPSMIEQKEDSIEDYLTSIGLDVKKFAINNKVSLDEILKTLQNSNHKIIEGNYEVLRSINAETIAPYTYRNQHMYLTDKELNKKVTLLRAKNISEHKIKNLFEMENSILRETFETLETKIASMENVGLKLSDENVDLLDKEWQNYENNRKELASFGIELEEQEIRNNASILFESPYVVKDLQVLKNYLMSIVRKNGKYALSIFWKKPQELITGIDDLIEANLENLIINYPEISGQKTDAVLKRVKYCEEKGQPIYSSEDKSSFYDYIIDSLSFYKEYGSVTDKIELISNKTVNDSLPSIIGNADYVEILVNSLNSYYQENSGIEINLTQEAKENFKLLKGQLAEQFNMTATGKYTYKINDVCISKNKFERNLGIILNALSNSGQPIEGVEKEIVLTAALYNLRQEIDILQKVVTSNMSKSGETFGGKKL